MAWLLDNAGETEALGRIIGEKLIDARGTLWEGLRALYRAARWAAEKPP